MSADKAVKKKLEAKADKLEFRDRNGVLMGRTYEHADGNIDLQLLKYDYYSLTLETVERLHKFLKKANKNKKS